jgi:FKBP-type peptidyl-prolyl cis-trans isomerase
MKSLFPNASFRLLVFALLGSGLLTTACNKIDEVPDYSAADALTIQKYLTDNSIPNAQKQPSGLYYVPITTNATAPQASVGKAAFIRYTGRLLDGTVVIASSLNGNRPSSFVVGSQTFLAGIEEGTSLMHLGDSAMFLAPSALAFGSRSNSKIPPNSVVRFDIKLLDVNPTIAVLDDKLIQQYLTVNKITNAQKQASGLYFVPNVTNSAGATTPGKTAMVLYTGKLLDGTVFDASSQHGDTLKVVVGAKKFVPGFEDGIALMHKGDKATLLLPSALAYGANSPSALVEPNTVLRFDVEVVAVK